MSTFDKSRAFARVRSAFSRVITIFESREPCITCPQDPMIMARAWS